MHVGKCVEKWRLLSWHSNEGDDYNDDDIIKKTNSVLWKKKHHVIPCTATFWYPTRTLYFLFSFWKGPIYILKIYIPGGRLCSKCVPNVALRREEGHLNLKQAHRPVSWYIVWSHCSFKPVSVISFLKTITNQYGSEPSHKIFNILAFLGRHS